MATKSLPRSPAAIVKNCLASVADWNEKNGMSTTFHPEYDLVQLKYDGWWVALKFRDGYCDFITSGGVIKQTLKLPRAYVKAQGVVIAEWMYGTHWAQNEKRLGHIYIHDVLWFESGKVSCNFLRKGNYANRSAWLEINAEFFYMMFPGKVDIVESFFRNKARALFLNNQDYEGIVLKKSTALFMEKNASVKIKHTYTMDYVCMAIVEGEGKFEGMLGSIAGGLYSPKGKLIPTCAVGGGFTDVERIEIWKHKKKYIGKVFQASGKDLFRKCVLRHPNFDRWREDKKPARCLYPS